MAFPPPPGSNRTSPPMPDPPKREEPPPIKSSTALTDDETAFILKTTLRPDQLEDPLVLKYIYSYLTCRNNPQASKDAGIDSSQGRILRRKPEVHACIEAITQKALMKYGYDSAEIVERTKELVNVDPIEFENPDGSFKTNMSQISPEARRAIKEFKCKNIFGQDANGMPKIIGQLVEVKLYDKIKPIEFLGREKQLFKETRVQVHDVTENMASVLLDSKRRAEQRVIGEAKEVIEITGRVENESE